MDQVQATPVSAEQNPPKNTSDDSQAYPRRPSTRMKLPPLKVLDQNGSGVKLPELESKSLQPLRKLGQISSHSQQKQKPVFDKKTNPHRQDAFQGDPGKVGIAQRLPSTNQSYHVGQPSPYRTRVLVKENITVEQHAKNIDFLQKIYTNKVEREKRILNQYKKQQQGMISTNSMTQLQKIYLPLKKTKKNMIVTKKIDKINEKIGKYPSTIKEDQFQVINNQTDNLETLKNQQTIQ